MNLLSGFMRFFGVRVKLVLDVSFGMTPRCFQAHQVPESKNTISGYKFNQYASVKDLMLFY